MTPKFLFLRDPPQLGPLGAAFRGRIARSPWDWRAEVGEGPILSVSCRFGDSGKRTAPISDETFWREDAEGIGMRAKSCWEKRARERERERLQRKRRGSGGGGEGSC